MDASSSSVGAYWVNGVLRTLTEEAVAAHFAQYGEVRSFRLRRNGQGESYGFGYLVMAHPSSLRHKGESWTDTVDGAELRVTRVNGTLPPSAEPPAPPPRPQSAPAKVSEPSWKATRAPSEVSSSSSMERARKAARRETRRQTRVEPHDPTQALPDQSPPPPPPLDMSHFFVCMPIDLCPPAYLHDPRARFARLDPHSLGTLYFTSKPVIHTAQQQAQCNALLWQSACPHAQTAAPDDAPPPPPPGPPPQWLTGRRT